MLGLVACGASTSDSPGMAAAPMVNRTEAGEVPPAKQEADITVADKDMTQEEAQSPTRNRIIIYTGHMEMVVTDVPTTIKQITQLAKVQGGYVSETNLYQMGNALQGSITIRILADNYQQTLAELRLLAVRITHESANTEDVTEEFVDLQARQENLDVTENALQQLLEERKRIGSTSDILEVHRELTDIRGQIEQIEGRLRYLSNQASLSTITIELYPDILAEPISVAGWQPSVVAKEALQTLVTILQLLANGLIWVVIFGLPLFILLIIPLAFIGRWVQQWRKNRATQ